MSEIRDRVIKQLVEVQTSEFSVDLRRRKGFTEAYIKRANQILSIKELAIVDREAERTMDFCMGCIKITGIKIPEDWVKEIRRNK